MQARGPHRGKRMPGLREELEENELKKVIKNYPHTKQADLAAFELLDNKTCGEWQGDVEVPGEGIGAV